MFAGPRRFVGFFLGLPDLLPTRAGVLAAPLLTSFKAMLLIAMRISLVSSGSQAGVKLGTCQGFEVKSFL